jgi:hypothetical protein
VRRICAGMEEKIKEAKILLNKFCLKIKIRSLDTSYDWP